MPNEPDRSPFDAPQAPREGYIECSHCKNPFPITEGNGSAEFPLCGVCDDD